MTDSFAGGRIATPLRMRRLPEPELSEDLTREVRGVAADHDAVVVGRILLHFVQRRGATAAALDHVRVLGSGAVVGRGDRFARNGRLVHGAAREVGHLFRHLHPRGIAALMARVGAGHGEAVVRPTPIAL